MALASQTARTQSMSWSSVGSSYRRRRQRRVRRVAATAGVIALAIGVAWAYTTWGDRSTDGPGGSGGADAGGTITTGGPMLGGQTPGTGGNGVADAWVPVPKSEPIEPERVVPEIEMGGSARGLGATASADPDAPVSLGSDGSGASEEGSGGAVEPTPRPVPGAGTMAADLERALDEARRATKEGRPVQAREIVNRVLLDRRTAEGDREALRAWLTELNDLLVFSPTIVANDPLVTSYRVKGGDRLSRIVQNESLAVDWRFITRINKMSNANNLREGQTLKLVRGPFHAIVDKSAFRLDLYVGPTVAVSMLERQNPATAGPESDWMYIRSFRVGLGEHDGTPVGIFVCRENSKLVDPAWQNPRTGERFASNDPKNPIGEHWLGIEGVDPTSKALAGYGLHGTIEPESIGMEKSMGCVRMLPGDIAVVWELLTERVSVVKVVP